MIDIKIKILTCSIVEAMMRNINDNFISISFDKIDDINFRIQFIFFKQTETELIEDLLGELGASLSNYEGIKIKEVIINIGSNITPLKYLVYQQMEQ